MKALRRLLGVLVMIAGILGLLLSLAGLVGVFMARPIVETSVVNTVATLNGSIDTSQKAMEVTEQALGATVDSVDALSTMLSTTAVSVEETQPVLNQLNDVIGKQLPTTLEAATNSLKSAEEAAVSLEGAMKSLDTFRAVMSAVPMVSAFLPPADKPYSPEKPLADSLGEVAVSLEAMPSTFTKMAVDMDKADDNLGEIESNLNTMSSSVALISTSLKEYQSMIGQSKSSMDDLKLMINSIQSNLTNTLNIATIVLGLFFFWLLAAQVVIFSQGWELFNGTAGRMEGGVDQPAVTGPATAPGD